MPVASTFSTDTVPSVGPRKRYSTVTTSPTWHIHKMGAGASLNGAAPRTAAVAANDLDPTVCKAGMVTWESLSEGGLFTMMGKSGQAIDVIDQLVPSGATASIVDSTGAPLRAVPAAVPYRVGPGEVLKITGGAAASKCGFLIKTADKFIW